MLASIHVQLAAVGEERFDGGTFRYRRLDERVGQAVAAARHRTGEVGHSVLGFGPQESRHR